MPEQPIFKRRSPIKQTPAKQATGGYAELHCRTNYSFLEGASHPDELVARAAELGLKALAITDRHSLAGVVRAHVAAKEAGLKLLVGAEIQPQEHSVAVLLATDRAAYGRLCRMLTVGRQQAPKGECLLRFADVETYAEGLLACVLLDPTRLDQQADELPRWRQVFGDRCYALAELHRGPRDKALLRDFQQLAIQAQLPFVAANGVYYHVPERRPLQDVVTAIRHHCTVEELGSRRFPNGERHIKSAAEMLEIFHDATDAVRLTQKIADRCTFTLDELKYEYPEEICPAGVSPMEYLKQLTKTGERERYPEGVPPKVRQQIDHELQLIEELNYATYFLTVYDLVKFARDKEILCQGRGSAANSAVCYCLQVTSVDPHQVDLLFERFISKERKEAPDIDIDFEHERREEVLQYIYDKYSRDRAGMTAEVITYRFRSAVRDVGKALGLSLDRVDALAKEIDFMRENVQLENRFREVGFDPTAWVTQQLLRLVGELVGFPRHLSQHVGGMVITQGPLCELVPIENASMPGRTVVEWNKDDLDDLGILKVDCLALGMLTAIRKSFDMLRHYKQQALTLATVPQEDSQVYDMIGRADTIGVFQIESRAQMSMLPRLKPHTWYDLVIEVAIVRPGPIQGDMVHPYLRRRMGLEPVTYPKPEIESVLKRTLGVPLFQEQAMKLVMVAGGFTPEEADKFRRAMGKWRKTGLIEQYREKLTTGMEKKGYTAEFIEQLINQISGFGEYGFPESHAASFAILVYVSCWLKCYHPAVFTASLINSQPMGFYAPSQLIADVRKHGVEVRGVDVNASNWDCTLEPLAQSRSREHAIRLGWRMLKGMSQTTADRIVACRKSGRFQSYDDFVRRTQFSPVVLALLSDGDAFRSLAESRRTAFWKSLPAQEPTELYGEIDTPEPEATLPVMTAQQQVTADYRTLRLSLRQHPVSFIRGELTVRRVLRTEQLQTAESGRRCKVGGCVILRQRPSTAKGITFMTLEDETGTANLIVRVDVWERFHRIARTATALIVQGLLQRSREGITHVLVDHMEDLSDRLSEFGNHSRDFR